MNIKNNFSKSFVTMALGAALLLPAMATVSAEEVASAPATAPAQTTEAQPAQTAPAQTTPAQTTEAQPAQAAPANAENQAPEDKEIQVQLGYKYTSERYGYSIRCPGKPEIIPASFFDETAKGDVLVFSGKDREIYKAWIILINAYDEADVPDNLGTLPEEEKKATVERFRDKFNFADASVVDLGDNRYGMYAITPKELDVDTNGDGQFDDVVVASNQMIKTYLKGAYGGHFEISLLDNPALSQEGIAIYNVALTTFQQWPTSKYQEFLDASKLPKKNKK